MTRNPNFYALLTRNTAHVSHVGLQTCVDIWQMCMQSLARQVHTGTSGHKSSFIWGHDCVLAILLDASCLIHMTKWIHVPGTVHLINVLGKLVMSWRIHGWGPAQTAVHSCWANAGLSPASRACAIHSVVWNVVVPVSQATANHAYDTIDAESNPFPDHAIALWLRSRHLQGSIAGEDSSSVWEHNYLAAEGPVQGKERGDFPLAASSSSPLAFWTHCPDQIEMGWGGRVSL